ncbi:hypothetical protein [Actinacidiphila paucisporea]|uniref:Uncharacterized protein n=1 Tax=Actinacidiphila paucisporea TaxID=310782 RepID=A0A1M6Z9A5_9ACTN|nr:hypothetical protein [Actinacidiphila paucisporea]SHL27020.1 hypothetical protein SAMN05216499_103260 [Actinacidiphila paucisporea]
MILHKGYGQETDDYISIRDQAELRETVQWLEAHTGRTASTLAEPGVMVRSPGINYVIGHGRAGTVEDRTPAEFVPEFVSRGLADGDTIWIISCWAGATSGYGFAQGLAAEFRALGRTGVSVRAPRNIIHWNANGPVLVDDYPTNAGLKAALAAITQGQDNAWRAYVQDLRACIRTALNLAIGTDAEGTRRRVVNFGEARPEDNKQKYLQGMIDRARIGPPHSATLTEIVNGAAAHPAGNPVVGRLRWAQELRSLLTDLHVLHSGNAAGQLAARTDISAAVLTLRTQITALWPAYSHDYYDAIRDLANPFASRDEGWVTFDDAHPAGFVH